MKVQDLYKALAERTGSTKAEAIKFVRALEGILTEEVRDKGEDIVIGGVGRFVQKVAAPRPGHNPLDGREGGMPWIQVHRLQARILVQGVRRGQRQEITP